MLGPKSAAVSDLVGSCPWPAEQSPDHPAPHHKLDTSLLCISRQTPRPETERGRGREQSRAPKQSEAECGARPLASSLRTPTPSRIALFLPSGLVLLPPTTMSFTPPTASRLQDLVRLKSTVLQRPYNPLNLRTGLTYLQRPLIGPTISSWYPLKMNDRMTRRILGLGNDWHNENTQRIIDKWDDLHAKGKFAVKKGTSLSFLRGAWSGGARPKSDERELTSAVRVPSLDRSLRPGKAGQVARQEGRWKEVGLVPWTRRGGAVAARRPSSRDSSRRARQAQRSGASAGATATRPHQAGRYRHFLPHLRMYPVPSRPPRLPNAPT